MPSTSDISPFLEYAKHIQASDKVLAWIDRNLANYAEKNALDTAEVEHIIDFLSSTKAPSRLVGMSYKEAKASCDKWMKTLQKKASGIEEKLADVETVLDFKDGFRVVRLVGKAAFEREGFLMRHCVSSYFGKSDEIFSLRDKDNMPHCTMSKASEQIKGKGNGDIHPKYIDYVVRFLEYTGMRVRDSEMEHLGYEVVPFGKYTKTRLYRDRYATKGSQIEYKDGARFFDKKSELKNYLGEDITLFRGDLVIEERESFVHKSLVEVSGSVYVREGATFTAPKLASSGYVDVREGATFTAPKLASSGYVTRAA